MNLGNFTTIGNELDLTSVQVGQYLIDLGYRVKDSKGIHVTNKAFKDGLAVNKTEKYGKDEYHLTKWNVDVTMEVIKKHIEVTPKHPAQLIDRKKLKDMVTVIDGITNKSPTEPTSVFEYCTFYFKRFNPVQTALLPHIGEDVNLVICTATASGKTVCAEMVMVGRQRKGEDIDEYHIEKLVNGLLHTPRWFLGTTLRIL